MPPTCSAINCDSKLGKRQQNVSFYRFPQKNSALLAEWLKVCKPNWKPSKWNLLCSKHFAPENIQNNMNKKLLRQDAVPTFFNKYAPGDPQHAEETKRAFTVKNEVNIQNDVLVTNGLNDNQEEQISLTCRLCANKSTENVPIFGDSNSTVAEKIGRCLPIIVSEADELPKHICKQCFQNLTISYELIMNSVRVDTHLRTKFVESDSLQISPILLQNEYLAYKQLHNSDELCEDKPYVINEEMIRNLKGPLPCDLCDATLEDVETLEAHVEETHLLQYWCNLCDDSFLKSRELKVHKNLHHSEQSREIKTEYPLWTETEEVPIKEELEESSLESTCTVCRTTFDNARMLEEHYAVHMPKNVECPVCQESCASIYECVVHQREVHEMYVNVRLDDVCGICGKFFENGRALKLHKNICPKKVGNTFACKYCGNTYTTNQLLHYHLRKHKNEMLEDPTVTVYECVTCPKRFVDKHLYNKHRNMHDPELWDKFKCTVCSRTFIDNAKRLLHESTHEGLKPHICDVCGRAFNRIANMKTHRERHFDRKCPRCEAVFEKPLLLTYHMRDVHGVKPKPRKQKKPTESNSFICKFCGKKLANYNLLLGHERIHTGDKPFGCEICGKSFRSYAGRWTHMKSHEKGVYVCEHCGKCFSSKLHLSRHLQNHLSLEERKFYECSVCGSRFFWKWCHDIHMRTHTGLRPYTCDICNFSFAQKGDMKRHRSKHTNSSVRKRKPKAEISEDLIESCNETVSVKIEECLSMSEIASSVRMDYQAEILDES